jgi:hypothetical protein
MGLDTTHGAWHGAYSAFNRWRDTMAQVAGLPLSGEPGMRATEHLYINWDEITEENIYGKWERTPEEPLVVLIAHSDCDGEILPEQAGPLADRLEELLPKITEGPGADGHIGRDGGMVAVTCRFIRGLRAAVAANEPLGFH